MGEIIADIVYVLCALTALTCAVLLARAYKGNPSRLLMFSSLCFGALALNSVLLVLDRVIWPAEVDLRLPRILVSAAGLIVMLWALITQKD